MGARAPSPSAGELALGLTRAESSRIALLLAGGGEFAFVVFKLAEDLGVLPDTLNKLLAVPGGAASSNGSDDGGEWDD